MIKPLGVILAGGLSSRMGGGDKPLRIIGGRTILKRVIDRTAEQCAGLVLNANGDPARFAEFKLPIAGDSIEGFVGPLAGILAGLDWAADNRPDVAEIVSLPADCPFLPTDLVVRLRTGRDASGMALAAVTSGGWAHPTIGLWPLPIRAQLRKALMEGERKIDRFTARIGIVHVDWPILPFDPFFNANAPEDVAEAEKLVEQHPDA